MNVCTVVGAARTKLRTSSMSLRVLSLALRQHLLPQPFEVKLQHMRALGTSSFRRPQMHTAVAMAPLQEICPSKDAAMIDS